MKDVYGGRYYAVIHTFDDKDARPYSLDRKGGDRCSMEVVVMMMVMGE